MLSLKIERRHALQLVVMVLMAAAVVAAVAIGVYAWMTIPECSIDHDCEQGICANSECTTGFVTVWDTAKRGESDDNQITLPLVESGSYDFTVDWGDGNRDRITEWDQPERTHTYSSRGEYTVVIEGEIEGWSFGKAPINREAEGETGPQIVPMNPAAVLTGSTYYRNAYSNYYAVEPIRGDAHKLLQVRQWGGLRLGDTGGYFEMAENLSVIAPDTPDLTGTTTLRDAFRGCERLTYIPSIDEWDVSGVENMSGMFEGVDRFSADIGGWDVSNVENMSRMFRGATTFNDDIGDWDVSGVEDMSQMFRGALMFDQDIGDWEVSNVRDMGEMFRGADSFERDIGEWEVSNVRDMSGMFSALELDDEIEQMDGGEVAYRQRDLFSPTPSFNRDIGDWDVSNVRDMSQMFRGNSQFNHNLNDWDVSGVEDDEEMFEGATQFEAQTLAEWYDSGEHDGDSVEGDGEEGDDERLDSEVVLLQPEVEGPLDTEIVQRVVRQHRRDLDWCYDSQLQEDPQLAGRIEMEWTVTDEGEVTDAAVAESAVDNDGIERCLIDRIEQWSFLNPDGEEAVVTQPLGFDAQ